ncbi:hypothetical protein ACIKT0_17405, partial [Hansschlegelia beijingensis]
GVLATLAMAAGTALTVAAIASLAVGAKATALRIASSRPGFGAALLAVLEVGAAALILAFGVVMLGGLLSDSSPLAG